MDVPACVVLGDLLSQLADSLMELNFFDEDFELWRFHAGKTHGLRYDCNACNLAQPKRTRQAIRFRKGELALT